MSSVVVTPRFYSTDSIVVAHGPSCSAACGTFPEQGSNTCLLHCQVDSLPLSHQGSLILYLLRPIPHCLNYYSFMSLEIRSFRTFNLVLFFFQTTVLIYYSTIVKISFQLLQCLWSCLGPIPNPESSYTTDKIGWFLGECGVRTT